MLRASECGGIQWRVSLHSSQPNMERKEWKWRKIIFTFVTSKELMCCMVKMSSQREVLGVKRNSRHPRTMLWLQLTCTLLWQTPKSRRECGGTHLPPHSTEKRSRKTSFSSSFLSSNTFAPSEPSFWGKFFQGDSVSHVVQWCGIHTVLRAPYNIFIFSLLPYHQLPCSFGCICGVATRGNFRIQKLTFTITKRPWYVCFPICNMNILLLCTLLIICMLVHAAYLNLIVHTPAAAA